MAGGETSRLVGCSETRILTEFQMSLLPMPDIFFFEMGNGAPASASSDAHGIFIYYSTKASKSHTTSNIQVKATKTAPLSTTVAIHRWLPLAYHLNCASTPAPDDVASAIFRKPIFNV